MISAADMGKLWAPSPRSVFSQEHRPGRPFRSASPLLTSPTLILCLRAFRISGSGVLKKVGWSSEQDSPLSPSFSLFLHPSLPSFHPSILYQLQLIFTKLLLCVKSWRENFPLILSESFEKGIQTETRHSSTGLELWQGKQRRAGRQADKSRNSISARSPSRHRFRGQVSGAASAEMGQRVSRMSSKALALDVQGS